METNRTCFLVVRTIKMSRFTQMFTDNRTEKRIEVIFFDVVVEFSFIIVLFIFFFIMPKDFKCVYSVVMSQEIKTIISKTMIIM